MSAQQAGELGLVYNSHGSRVQKNRREDERNTVYPRRDDPDHVTIRDRQGLVSRG